MALVGPVVDLLPWWRVRFPSAPSFLWILPVLTGYEPLIRHAFVHTEHTDVTSFRFRPHLLWRICGVDLDATFHIPSHNDLHLRSTFEWMCGCFVPIRAPDRRNSCWVLGGTYPFRAHARDSRATRVNDIVGGASYRQYGGC